LGTGNAALALFLAGEKNDDATPFLGYEVVAHLVGNRALAQPIITMTYTEAREASPSDASLDLSARTQIP
jgi:hypothetical protein